MATYVGWALDDNAANTTVIGTDVNGALAGGKNTDAVDTIISGHSMFHLDGAADYVEITTPVGTATTPQILWPSTYTDLWTKSASNPVLTEAPSSVRFGQLAPKPGGGWYFFGCQSHIYRWESADLITWSNKTLMLSNGGGGAWDQAIQVVTAFQIPDGTWVLFYRGSDGGAAIIHANGLAIGKATSVDGVNWVKKDNSGVNDGYIDEFGVNYDPVGCILVDGTYYLYINGEDAGGGTDHGTQNIYTSNNLTDWSKTSNSPIFGDKSGHFCGSVAKLGDYYYILCPLDYEEPRDEGLYDHMITLYRSTDPTFPRDNRQFMGFAITNDQAYDDDYLDTPSFPRLGITGEFSFEFGNTINTIYNSQGELAPDNINTQSLANQTIGTYQSRLFDYIAEEMTYSFWVQFDTIGNGDALFSIGDIPNEGNPVMFSRLNTASKFLSFYGSGGYNDTTFTPVADTLYHIAVTRKYESSAWVCYVYVDGALLDSYSFTPRDSGDDAKIFLGTGFGGGAANYLDGYIGEFRMYPWALSDSEVSELFTTSDVNVAPEVVITRYSTSVDLGSSVLLTATAYDVDDGAITDISWSSSLDGSLGSGTSLTVNDLSAGTHAITASVTDSGGLVGSATVVIIVLFELSSNVTFGTVPLNCRFAATVNGDLV